MKLMPSKFNIIVKDEGTLLVYNSVQGISSLCKISEKKYPGLCSVLNHNKTIESDKVDKTLVLNNILVEDSCNEEIYRKFVKYSALYDSGTNFIIMPTEQCNFRCAYCYESFDKPKMSEEVLKNLKGYLTRNIHRFQSLSLDWFGGEPLCAYEVITDVMQLCKFVSKNTGVPVISTMTTNGYLLTKNVVAELLKLNVVAYQVTIDGIKEVHDKQRRLKNGSGTYETIVQNLLDIKNEIKSGILSICIRVNLNTASIKFVDRFFQFLKENFEDDNRFSISLRYVRDLKGIGKTKEIITDDTKMLTVYKQAAKIIPRLLTSHFIDMLDSSGICYAGKPNSMVIGSDGQLYKCTVHFNDAVNVVGNLKNYKLHTNNNKVSRWIFSNEETSQCKECWYRGACYDGTCPYFAITSPQKKTCPFEKIHIDYILKFLNNQNKIKELGS